ncbi:MAG TPA: type II toxin-antitoxin system RelE/ParE family toxin [Telluria sp.]|jgi:putative addiction module killer protein
MFTLFFHPAFTKFFLGIKDKTVQLRVNARLLKMRQGLLGDVEPVGDGVWEAKLDVGAGWRIYYIQTGREILFLLGGGTKKGQQNDIDAAKKLARTLKNKP